jgi:outer membrane protein OmpA-like peptidoglycan-associated protein
VADWTSTGGSVAGQGSTGSVSTAGIEPGQITIGATCTDARGLKTQSSTQVTIQAPPVVNKELEARLALHSVYFPTAQPTVANPNAGLVPSQEQTLLKLSADFKEFIQNKPDARLTLYGHADVRGSVEYNQALSERRVARVKSFLVENGVPEASIDTQALGDQHNLSEADVKASVERNTELSPEERAKVLQNIKTIIWASNRRVDITLNSAGQTEKSVREYPFNAKDSLTLISDREAAAKKHPVAKKHTKKKE